MITTDVMGLLDTREKRNASKLISSGVSVEFIEYPGVLHGFFGLTQMIDEADAANIVAGKGITRVMAT